MQKCKTSRQGKPRKPIKFNPFSENKTLCVCSHIDLYIDEIKHFREGKSKTLLSFIKQHKAISSQTVSC